jgi:hypothetical protein
MGQSSPAGQPNRDGLDLHGPGSRQLLGPERAGAGRDRLPLRGNLFSLEPFAGLRHLHLEGAQVRESGSAAALVGRTRDLDVTASLLGLRATAALPVGTGALSVNGTLAWRHTFEAPVRKADLAFATGSLPFLVQGVPVAQDALCGGDGAFLCGEPEHEPDAALRGRDRPNSPRPRHQRRNLNQILKR